MIHTNSAYDGSTAVVLLGLKFGVQAGEPFKPSASSSQMVERVGHFDSLGGRSTFL